MYIFKILKINDNIQNTAQADFKLWQKILDKSNIKRKLLLEEQIEVLRGSQLGPQQITWTDI